MKIAICLSGYTGWLDGSYYAGKSIETKKSDMTNFTKNNPTWSFNSLKNKIVDVNVSRGNEIDFFIHTWNIGSFTELMNLYDPKLIRAEPQDPFDKGELDNFGVDYNPEMGWNNKFRCYSKFNAAQRGLKLVRKYEDAHRFKYDYVLVTRLDLIMHTNLIFSDFDPDILWVGDWSPGLRKKNRMRKRFNDIIYFSNSDIMHGFVTEYKNIDKFSKDRWRKDLPSDPHSLFASYCISITDKIKMFWKANHDYQIVRLTPKHILFKLQ